MAEEPECYCSTCLRAFQTWLREKFGTISELNRRWGMSFWSQSYDSFDAVILPKAGHNPSALLDYHRFLSRSFLNYARLQTNCIKRISPKKIVTHNICSSGFLYRLDLYELGQQLDVASIDNYPITWTLENEYGNSGDRAYQPEMASFALTMTRGYKHKAFWVTEAQVGRTFKPRRLPEPGLINVWTHQELAHGARAVMFFHWRQFPFGIEHLLQAILECDGKPRRRYFEVQKVFAELSQLPPELARALPRPEVAILRDFECDWALDDGHAHPDFRYLRHLYLYYTALYRNHLNTDVISPADDLTGYKLVLAPSYLLVDEIRAQKLRSFVESGGRLLLTCQSGLRNLDNVFHQIAQPAHLRDLCGIEIEEQNGLKFQDTIEIKPVAANYTHSRYTCSLLMELLTVTTATPLATYADHWFAGSPCATINRVGSGFVYYIATVPSVSFLQELVKQIAPECGLAPNIISASSTEVESVRSFAEAREYLHLINYTPVAQEVVLAGNYQIVTNQHAVSGTYRLPPFGAVILEKIISHSPSK